MTYIPNQKALADAMFDYENGMVEAKDDSYHEIMKAKMAKAITAYMTSLFEQKLTYETIGQDVDGQFEKPPHAVLMPCEPYFRALIIRQEQP